MLLKGMYMMDKIGFCGCFAYGQNTGGGQISKSRNIKRILSKKFGSDNILLVDTYNWKKNFVNKLIKCMIIPFQCKVIIIMPGINGLKVMLPMFLVLKMIFKFTLIYPVVGGWLPEVVYDDKILLKRLKTLDALYVETKHMQKLLKSYGLNNVFYMPNFSLKNPIKQVKFLEENPYRFCIFSRVAKEKGINEAVDAVIEINKRYGNTKCALDIYGFIDDKYSVEFYNIIKNKDNVNYGGILTECNTIEKLSSYYCLLFPTYHKGEGFPATLLESMMSGLPVIATDWRYNSEIIKDKYNGMLYQRNKDNSNLINEIIYSIEHPDEIHVMRMNCIKEAKRYQPLNSMSHMINLIRLKLI